ncbi:MAG: hypothetical protein QM813_20775 [Verrucomicrobiota bacterium]
MHKWWIAIRRFMRAWSLPKVPAGRRWIVFNDGRVAFLAPTDYAMHRERDETVAVYPPGDDSGITLRFSLHTRQLHPQMRADVAEQFVVDHAKTKGLPLTRLSDRVFLTESREDDWPDRRVMMHYWQVGAGRILVVCSATIWGSDRESATVRRALAVVPQVIESFRLT